MNKHNFSMINKEVWAKNNINHENHGYDSINSGRDNPSIYKTLSIEPNIEKSAWGNLIKHIDFEKVKECSTFLLTEEISFSQKSEWESLDIYPNIGGVPTIGDFMAMGGVGEGPGSVVRSKQYWKNSGYIKLNPQVRLIDWNGEGLCEKMALLLSAYTVPLFSTSVEKEAGNLLVGLGDKLGGDSDDSTVINFIKLFGEALQEEEGTDIADSIFQAIADAVGGTNSVILGGVENITDEIREAIGDYLTLRMSPPVLKVRVGSIFHHEEMILKDFNVKFSKEFTKNGPLYADVSLDLESRKVVKDISDTGLFTKPPNYKKNISIVNEDLTKEEERPSRRAEPFYLPEEEEEETSRIGALFGGDKKVPKIWKVFGKWFRR